MKVKDFIEFIKLPPNILAAVSVVAGIILFIPDKLAKKMYIYDLRNDYGVIVSIVFLISFSVLIVLLTILIYKKIDKNIKSDMEFRLGNETIIIVYRDEQFQFKEMPNSKELNYPYIYMGLQKALMSFILHENNNIDEEILIDEMEPPENPL